MLTRRALLAGTTALTLAGAEPCRAWIHGGIPTNNNRVTINAPAGYLNIAKTFAFNIDPTNQSSDGYPVTTPSSSWTAGSSPSMPAGYYGSFVWKFSGQGSMQVFGSVVVTSGGTSIVGLGTNTGDASGNVTILSQTNPRVVFAFGWNIQAISQGASNGSGGNFIRISTKTGYFANGGATGLVVNITGANTNTGANGTWTVTQIDNQTFDLQGTVYTNAQASAAGTAIYVGTALSIFMLGSGTFSSMSNLVWCKAGDETAITNGQIIDNTLLSQLQALMGGSSPSTYGWLRFMDLSGVQANYEGDFSQRMPSTYLCYTAQRWCSGYWTGAITNSSDAYTCSDPSVSTWSGSAYIDNAIVQGAISATNTGGTPTLNVGGHGAKPIVNTGANPIIFSISAPPASSGLTMQWHFSATWLNGGTTYTFSYTTVSGDTASIAALNASLEVAFSADTTLSGAGIQFTNSAQVVANPRTAQAGRLTVTYTSGPAICTMTTIPPSTITGNSTFIYNLLLDAWIYFGNNGLTQSVPFEAIADYCNRVGAHCWYNWGVTKSAFITAVTNFFATNLNTGLKLGTETGNEVWNSGAFPFEQWNNFGMALGFAVAGDAAVFSYTALRTIQYAALSKAAWAAASRPANTHYIFQMNQTGEATSGNFDTWQLKGTALNASSNTIYATYGGLNGGSAPSYTATGSRPVDITTAIGCAPYWGSPWWGGSASLITGTVTVNAPWLQAALNYANGSTATAFTSLVNQFNGTTLRSSGSDVGLSLATYYGGSSGVFKLEEAIAAEYDTYRAGAGLGHLGIIHYEAGPQWATGAQFNNGVNSVNSGDISALAGQMTALSWNVSAYTVSGTNNTTEMATMVITMQQAWKYDPSYAVLIETYYYQAFKTVSGANREAKPAQYGYAASQWCLFPVTYPAGNQYENYNAIVSWDAGS